MTNFFSRNVAPKAHSAIGLIQNFSGVSSFGFLSQKRKAEETGAQHDISITQHQEEQIEKSDSDKQQKMLDRLALDSAVQIFRKI